MEKIIGVFLGVFVLAGLGCSKKFVQLYTVEAKESKVERGTLVFENDAVVISYYFWEENGVLAFSVHNKSDKPLYIDWKKSAFISGIVKLDYWVDITLSKSEYREGGFYYSQRNENELLAFFTSYGRSSTVTVKPERVTFIPPHSIIFKSDFVLSPNGGQKLEKTQVKTGLEKPISKPGKPNNVYSQSYNIQTSPLHFRNFLAFSFSEDFGDEFYVDNSFFVKEIIEMRVSNFEKVKYKEVNGKLYPEKDQNGWTAKEIPSKNPMKFYIRLNSYDCIECR